MHVCEFNDDENEPAEQGEQAKLARVVAFDTTYVPDAHGVVGLHAVWFS